MGVAEQTSYSKDPKAFLLETPIRSANSPYVATELDTVATWKAPGDDKHTAIVVKDQSKKVRKFDLSKGPDGVCQLSVAAEGLKGYYLPFKLNHTYAIHLDNEASLFFTAPMNGCAVFAFMEKNKTLRVIHTNHAPDLADMSAQARQRQIEQRTAFYDWFEKKKLWGNYVKFRPEFYLDETHFSTANAGVHGFREAKTWHLYYHIILAKKPAAMPEGVTCVQSGDKWFIAGTLWPETQMPTWPAQKRFYFF